jgi:putative DNA primase/helicase
MVAKFQDGDELKGCHLTYLDSIGQGKANVVTPKKTFSSVGTLTGSVIHLFEPEQDSPLILCEGIETAIACHESMGWPVWACGNATLLEKVNIPSDIQTVYIGADLDQSQKGMKAAQQLAHRLQAEGRDVFIVIPAGPIPENRKSLDWVDIHNRNGMDVVRSAFLNAKPWQPSSDKSWESPNLFSSIETPEIPSSLLPTIFGEFAEALSIETETPSALAVFGVLGAVSASIAHRYFVSPKQGWEEPINCYLLLALPPGNAKSIVLRRCTKPIMDWERRRAEELLPEIARIQSERKTQERIIDQRRREVTREEDRDRQLCVIHQITLLEQQLPEPPVVPNIFATDATPESLAQSTHEQGGRYAILSDEGGIMEVISGLYSGGQANINIILNGIDGGPVRIRRKEQSTDLNPYLTFLLIVQPVIIKTMGEKRTFIGKGMMERFLYALPKSHLGYRSHQTDSMPLHIQNEYDRQTTALLDSGMSKDNSDQERLTLTLTPDALNEWQDFRAEIETQLRPSGKLYPILGWGGKLCGYALRLAGLLHIMEHVSRDNRVISRQTMNNALELSALLIDHALTAFELFGVDKQTENTKRVYEWIKSNGQRFFKQNDCHKALHGQFAKISELRDVLAELMERNIISKSEQIKTGGRPSIINYVNPAIFGDVNCWAGVKFSKHQLRILVILVTKVSTMKTLVAFVT